MLPIRVFAILCTAWLLAGASCRPVYSDRPMGGAPVALPNAQLATDWLLAREQTEPCTGVPRLENPVVVYIEANSLGDWSAFSPAWVRLTLDQNKVQRLWDARRLCARENLESAEILSVCPDAWEGEKDRRIVNDGAVVTKDWFWFRAHPKHDQHDWETRCIMFDELADLLARGNQAATAYLAWCDGMLFCDSSGAKSFVQRLVEDGVVELNEARIEEMP